MHVQDAAKIIDLIMLASIGQFEAKFEPYLIAVDNSVENGSTQASIMKAISEGIGSGATKQMSSGEVLGASWCEFLQVDVTLKMSASIQQAMTLKSPKGICSETMSSLNDEFNKYRGLFPMKVFITGPPGVGKTYFAEKLCEEYGVPHITVKTVVEMGYKLTNDLGQKLKARVETL